MSDLISRSALMREFADFVRASNNSDFADVPTWNDAVSLLGSAPTIEAEPIKPGRWIIGFGENGEPIGTYCSECGWSWVNGVAAVNLNKGFSLIKTPRCPWCGAKMDEVEE